MANNSYNKTDDIIKQIQDSLQICDKILSNTPRYQNQDSQKKNSFEDISLKNGEDLQLRQKAQTFQVESNFNNYQYDKQDNFINQHLNEKKFQIQQEINQNKDIDILQNNYQNNEQVNQNNDINYNEELKLNKITSLKNKNLQTEEDMKQLEKEFMMKEGNQYIQNSCIFKEKTLIFVDPKEIIQQRIESNEEALSRQSRIDLGNYDKNLEKKYKHSIESFLIIKKLGEGKFSEVFIAKDKLTGFHVALKKIKYSTIIEFNLYQDITNEILMQSMLKHKNIIQLYGFFITNDSVYLIQELACGKELFTEAKSQPNKSYNESIVSLYIRQVADALHYMHMCNILHRDIKPENILICDGILKICDFGYAAPFSKLNLRSTFCGTLEYVSPEMIESKKYNNSVDIWALGILTYELIFGRSPFNGKDHEEVFKNVLQGKLHFYGPVTFECGDFISRLLKKEPSQRMKLAQVLKHPFIINVKENVNIYDKSYNMNDFEFLKN